MVVFTAQEIERIQRLLDNDGNSLQVVAESMGVTVPGLKNRLAFSGRRIARRIVDIPRIAEMQEQGKQQQQ